MPFLSLKLYGPLYFTKKAKAVLVVCDEFLQDPGPLPSDLISNRSSPCLLYSNLSEFAVPQTFQVYSLLEASSDFSMPILFFSQIYMAYSGTSFICYLFI